MTGRVEVTQRDQVLSVSSHPLTGPDVCYNDFFLLWNCLTSVEAAGDWVAAVTKAPLPSVSLFRSPSKRKAVTEMARRDRASSFFCCFFMSVPVEGVWSAAGRGRGRTRARRRRR